ncbi:uncharacterized protein LOC125683058 [Ostrea edulis]|uniref:uncharacterized protein LOC125683058 n=1 Tax=Ostrea edulis TaxID=37623 RepID=UPI002094873E|nr:uncharacterized protein LOC125683058 [Ostrea edulis]
MAYFRYLLYFAFSLTTCIAQRSTLDRCELGRHISQRCVGFTIPPRNDCPSGFFCFTPADGPGPCCLENNPCPIGSPLQSNNDAITCITQRCPTDHECVSDGQYAVCCPKRNPRPNCSQSPCSPLMQRFCALPIIKYLDKRTICQKCHRNMCTHGSRKKY